MVTAAMSSSVMVAVAVAAPRVTPSGNPRSGANMLTWKVSSPSTSSSSMVSTITDRLCEASVDAGKTRLVAGATRKSAGPMEPATGVVQTTSTSPATRPVRVTGTIAISPSATDTISAMVTMAVSSSAMVAVAVAVPRATPSGRPPAPAVSVTENVSSPSTRSSSPVCTSTVFSFSPAAKVTGVAAWAV